MSNRTVSARVHVHATFTATRPAPLFIAGVEVLEGKIDPDMYVNIPLNASLSVTVRILATAPIRNDFGLDLLGLVLNCDNDEEWRDFIDCLNIGDESWDITIEGED
jgi:hypothetical protein